MQFVRVLLSILILVVVAAGCHDGNGMFLTDSSPSVTSEDGSDDSGNGDDDGNGDDPEPCDMLICYCNGTFLQTVLITCDDFSVWEDYLGATAGACPNPAPTCIP